VTTISEPRDAALPGRSVESEVLRDVLTGIRAGRSEVLLLIGEAGIGKSALLRQLENSAADCTVLQTTGVESDMELAYAGLQQLCGPVMGFRSGLPAPQREALEAAFGLTGATAAPDRFLVGLAVLGLLASAATDRPVLCVVDDVQWLDQASAQTLFFVARRLHAESVGLTFSTRTPVDGASGLPVLSVGGLDDDHARSLVESVLPGRLDTAIVDRIIAESRGNPLALLEIPKRFDFFDLTGRTRSRESRPVIVGIEAHYHALISDLPGETRSLLLVAAAEPVGDPSLLLRAMQHLGIGPAALSPAEEEGLIEVDTRVQFCHPLARSVAYRAATVEQRREAHAALAVVTDVGVDPDRRAWHRALAADSADDDVAQELERSADRARSRGGVAAAAAFLTRAVELTVDPAVRSARALAAADTHREVAAFDVARRLLTTAELGPLTELQQARVEQLRTRLAFVAARVSGNAHTLVGAVAQFAEVASRLEGLDAALACEAYLEAMSAAMYVGRSAGMLATEIGARAKTGLQDVTPTHPLELVTRALAERLADGAVSAMPAMRAAVDTLLETTRAEAHDGWFWRAFPVVHESLIHETWDDGWRTLATHAVRSATEHGALALLPAALLSRAGAHMEHGEFASATALVAEAHDLAVATNHVPLKYHKMALAAWMGDERTVTELAGAAIESGAARGEGRIVGLAHYATAVLNNGLGRYPDALGAARSAFQYDDLGFFAELLIEVVEAGARGGDRELADRAWRELQERALASGTPRALGSLARSQALLSEGEQAEASYLEAIARFEETSQVVHLARVRLLYGEWLRRNGPSTVAREPLRVAFEEFTRMGSTAFAERARRELQAAGQKVRKQPTTAGEPLSPQEFQIAQSAGQGLTNQEIANQLFISAHTVEWHLRKVFTKMGIRSRRELRQKFSG
jgi:DNA-binding CsgD family transcriptional regulator